MPRTAPELLAVSQQVLSRCSITNKLAAATPSLALPKASQPQAPIQSHSPGTKVLDNAMTEHAVLVFHCT